MAMTMQELMRLAGWGGAASAALLLAVMAGVSGSQQQRALAQVQDQALAQRDSQATQVQAALAAQLTRLAVTEEETGRLTELLRGLIADRERLMSRLSALERNLEDVVTGSIQKPPATPATEPSAPAPEPPTIAAQAAAPVPAETSSPPIREPAPKGPRVAAAPATPAAPASTPPAAEPDASPRPAAGVDIGGASNFDGLRALWHTLTLNYVDLLGDLHPIVVVRENSKSRTADLRLVAGPLSDVDTASRICATLTAAKRACRLAVYEGQPLSLTAPEPPRRPVAPRPRP